MKSNLINSFLVSLIFLVLLNICFGSYFLEYESFLNAIAANEFSLPLKMDLFINVFVGLFPIVSFLNLQFDSSQFFSLMYFVLNLSLLTTLIANLFFYLKLKQIKATPRVIYTSITLLLLLPSQILISNHYTSILMGFAACLSLYTIQHYQLHKSNYVLVIVLILLSYLVRFEVASILYLLFPLYAFLYYKKLVKRALIILAVSLSIQGVYAYLLSENEGLSAIFTFEHEIQDRESVNFEEMESKEWFKFKAMGRFIIDDPNFTIQDYSSYLKQHDKLSYVLDNTLFIGIYKNKVADLLEQLLAFKGYLFLIITLSLFSFYVQIKNSTNKHLIIVKFISINVSLIAIPLGLSLFLLCSPEIVFSMYCAAGVICLLYLVIKRKFKTKELLVLAIPLVIVSFFYIKPIIESQTQESKLAESLRKEMLSSVANNETLVFTYPANFSYYQSKLFQNNLTDYTPHYYLDLGLINHVKIFKEYNQYFFGKSYHSLQARMMKCATDENIVLISTDDYNKFLTQYIEIMYQETFEFKIVPNSNIEGELNKYHLSYSGTNQF